MRFNLTGNAAGVFAGGDFPGVRAADDTSALPSGNSADVVSRVGVSYVAVVVAILDNGGIEPGDTAEVRDINEGFLLQCERGKVKGAFLVRLLGGDVFRVDAHAAFAVAQNAAVLPRDTAGAVIGRDGDGGFAFAHKSALGIQSDDAACGCLRADLSVKAAVFDRSVVHTGDAADVFAVPGGVQRAGDRKVLHHAGFQHHAEKPLCRSVAVKRYAEYTVAAAVKRSGKQRDGRKIAAGETDIARENDRFVL